MPKQSMILPFLYFRFIDGIALAATYSSIVSLLMVIFPSRTGTIVASVEAFYGIGLTFGRTKTEYVIKPRRVNF